MRHSSHSGEPDVMDFRSLLTDETRERLALKEAGLLPPFDPEEFKAQDHGPHSFARNKREAK